MPSHSSYAIASWLFLRLLGAAYFFAFWSLAGQLPGLIGHDGILPAAQFMVDVRDWADGTGVGLDRYRLVPTLFWLATGDRVLQGLAIAGAGLAALLVAGIAPAIVLPLLWVSYLSLTVVCRDFLAFQWDGLLLETGLLAVCLAPPAWRDRLREACDPPRLARWLLWWLLFRLMFASGIVKLASGDPAWRDLTALAVHYETQPLPTPLAWYAWALPLWFHRLSTLLVLLVELALPWLIVFRQRWRRLAAVVLVGFQLLIALTGNYAFFNLLTAALCVLLLDDAALGRLLPWRSVPARPAHDWRRHWLPVAMALITGPVSVATLAGQAGLPSLRAIEPLGSAIEPLRSVNAYGLFAVMTTTRPEIVVEGSNDGVTWRPYEFRHKPGVLARRPEWVAPFQPRLDWQMWFAALGRYEEELWFQRFCVRLLEGSSSVAGLLAENPFAPRPPQFVRATLYRYRFAPPAASRDIGAWWARERIREYAPVMSLNARIALLPASR